MDELDLFRDFRRGVAAPSAEARRRASARLERATTGGHARPAKLRVYRLVAAAFVAVSAAFIAALSLIAPWKSSAGFLEQAQAALVPPAGVVLHEKWELTTISRDPRCTVKRGPSEIWIDQTPPYRYRALLNEFRLDPFLDPRALVCAKGKPMEVGGTLDPQHTLRFVPPNTLRPSGPIRLGTPPDPVRQLRDSIREGQAHDEGKSQLGGRVVERIRMDPTPCPSGFPDCPRDPTYAYVDPDTFHPVQIESPHGYIIGSHLRFDGVIRILTYEYLPRTADNLRMADIRAQHPNATP
jgi:hypothetical protein